MVKAVRVLILLFISLSYGDSVLAACNPTAQQTNLNAPTRLKTASGLNIRSGPSTGCAVKARIRTKQIYTFHKKTTDNWYQIQYLMNGRTEYGWVSGDYLKWPNTGQPVVKSSKKKTISQSSSNTGKKSTAPKKGPQKPSLAANRYERRGKMKRSGFDIYHESKDKATRVKGSPVMWRFMSKDDVEITHKSPDGKWYWGLGEWRENLYRKTYYWGAWFKAEDIALLNPSKSEQDQFCQYTEQIQATRYYMNVWRARGGVSMVVAPDDRCQKKIKLNRDDFVIYLGETKKYWAFRIASIQTPVYFSKKYESLFDSSFEKFLHLQPQSGEYFFDRIFAINRITPTKGIIAKSTRLSRTPFNDRNRQTMNTVELDQKTEVLTYGTLDNHHRSNSQNLYIASVRNTRDGKVAFGFIPKEFVLLPKQQTEKLKATAKTQNVLFGLWLFYFCIMIGTKAGRNKIADWGYWFFGENNIGKNWLLGISVLGFAVAVYKLYGADAWLSDKSAIGWWLALAIPFIMLTPFFVYISYVWITSVSSRAADAATIKASTKDHQYDYARTHAKFGGIDPENETIWSAKAKAKRYSSIAEALRRHNEAYQEHERAAENSARQRGSL